MRLFPLVIVVFIHVCQLADAQAQSGRFGGYSESTTKTKGKAIKTSSTPEPKTPEEETIRIETDLVTVPVRVTSKSGKPTADLKQSEFKIFENGVEQEIAYFLSIDQPFTVALMLDMSYSSVFKLDDIQTAAKLFVKQLRENDRVMVIAFDEKASILCEPTNDRKVLNLAIEGSKIGSGTSLYDALDLAVDGRLRSIPGRKAVVLLSDGVDTRSAKSTEKKIASLISEEDVLMYPLRYDTFDDVRKTRTDTAEIRYDDNDKPYIFEKPPEKGERETDYEVAKEFLDTLAERSGGRVNRVSSSTNLNTAFARIADELRKTYSLGYYPREERRPGEQYTLKVRIYRPDLVIRTRESYSTGPE